VGVTCINQLIDYLHFFAELQAKHSNNEAHSAEMTSNQLQLTVLKLQLLTPPSPLMHHPHARASRATDSRCQEAPTAVSKAEDNRGTAPPRHASMARYGRCLQADTSAVGRCSIAGLDFCDGR
jgi:hypothetical protein